MSNKLHDKFGIDFEVGNYFLNPQSNALYLGKVLKINPATLKIHLIGVPRHLPQPFTQFHHWIYNTPKHGDFIIVNEAAIYSLPFQFGAAYDFLSNYIYA